MLNTKLGFFYVHRFARLIYEVTKSIYETYGCLFPNIYCSSDASMCWFGDLTGNRQPFVYPYVNLPVYSQTNTCIMKKELTAHGFIQLFSGEAWQLRKGGKYFVTKNHSSLFAFEIGDGDIADGLKFICAHSDSPTFRVKPNAEMP